MTVTTVSALKAREQFTDILSRAAYAKTRTLVTKNGKKVAAIVSIEDFELLERLVTEAERRTDSQDAKDALEEIKTEGALSLDETRQRKGW